MFIYHADKINMPTDISVLVELSTKSISLLTAWTREHLRTNGQNVSF